MRKFESLAQPCSLRQLLPLWILLSLALPQLCALSGAQEPDSEGFRPMFDGTSLDGWVPVNTAPSTWKIEEGMLICFGRPVGELRTERMYQNFILEVEWRHMVPGGNAGIFLWADDITAKGQPFHRGIEVQVLENAYGNTQSHTTHGDIFPIHGARMTPVNGRGGDRAFPTEERSNPSPEWNHYRIECRDGTVTLAVNGKQVTAGNECSPRKGYICIESEGGTVHYRNFKIKELPDTPVDPADIAIADRGYRCLYTGVDLSGWSVAEQATANWQSSDWVLRCTGEVQDAAGALQTTESFQDYGFLCDVRWKPETQQVIFELRGASESALVLDPTDERLKALLNLDGWNRIETELKGDRLTVKVNNQLWLDQVTLNDCPAEGPLKIMTEGAADFANPFVRQLKD